MTYQKHSVMEARFERLGPRTKNVHKHHYKAAELNRQGVALECFCGVGAQFYPVWNKPIAPER